MALALLVCAPFQERHWSHESYETYRPMSCLGWRAEQ